jgi:hypothetical protein
MKEVKEQKELHNKVRGKKNEARKENKGRMM